MSESDLFKDCQVLNFLENRENIRLSQMENTKTVRGDILKGRRKRKIHRMEKVQLEKLDS